MLYSGRSLNMCLTVAVIETAHKFCFTFGVGFPLFYAGQLVALMLSNLKYPEAYYQGNLSIIFQVDSNC